MLNSETSGSASACFVLIDTDAEDQLVLPDADAHIAMQQKPQTAEHFLLHIVRSRFEDFSNPGGEVFIVCHADVFLD